MKAPLGFIALVWTLTVLSLLGAASPASATQLTWTGAASTDMLNRSNWSPAQIPTASDDLIIRGASVSLNSNLTVNSLDISDHSSLSGSGNLSVTSSFKTRDSTFSGTGTLTLSSGSTNLVHSLEGTVSGMVENRFERVVYNYGQMTWSGGKIFLGQNFYNQAGGLLVNRTDGIFYSNVRPKPSFFNAGEFIKQDTIGQTNIAVSMQNSGIIRVNSGRLNLPAEWEQVGGLTELNGGLINGTGNAPILYTGGMLAGTGEIQGDVMNDGALVAPGHSPGTLTISGNYTQTSTSTLTMEIGGTTPGTGYDQLVVNGTASLAGTINLVRYNNFVPDAGASFKLITYYSAVGSFAAVNGLHPSGQLFYRTTQAPTYFLAAVENDTTLPSVAITTAASSTNPISCSGTASDAESGLASVTLMVYRYGSGSTSAGYWAGGTSWTPEYSAANERPVVGTSNWSLALPSMPSMGFSVRATATDQVGNKRSTTSVVDGPPTISTIANQSVSEDSATAAVAFSVNDAVTEAARLSVTATSSNSALVPAAGINLGGSGANRTISLMPAANQSGSTTITLQVSDGTDTTSTTFVLQVLPLNDAPTVVNDTATTNEDTALDVAVLPNDGDIDGDQLRVSRVATTAATHGSVTLNTNGTLHFVPEANYSGTSTWSYTISDGSAEATATVTVQVLAVNDAPLAQGQSLQIANGAATSLVLGATDNEGDSLSFEIVTPPAHGSLSGTAPNLTYTPVAGYGGSDSFAFRASDGKVSSASATVTLQISAAPSSPTPTPVAPTPTPVVPSPVAPTPAPVPPTATPTPTLPVVTPTPVVPAPVNQAPVGVSETYLTIGRPLSVLLSQGVLRNDRDPEGAPLQVVLVRAPRLGTLRLISNGTFVYTPSASYAGRDSFAYAAFDGALRSAPVEVPLLSALGADRTPPRISITSATAPLWGQRLLPLAGVASDPFVVSGVGVAASGLKNVMVQLRRFDGQSWNGRGWQVALFKLPAVVGTGGIWRLSAPLPGPTLVRNGRYQWIATATDNVGRITIASQFVNVDTVPPTVTIETPAVGSIVALTSASGRAVGAFQVDVALRNERGLYWNGRLYQSAPFFLPSTLSLGRWVVSRGLPAGASLPVGRYTLLARARDEAGNTSTVARSLLVTSSATT